jgi:transglutaminase-like putative cysteine protease
VYLDGIELAFADQPPIIASGRTLVPLRFVSEAFGAQVDWDPATGSVPIALDDINVMLRIGRREVVVNERTVLLDVAPTLINGRTMVPLRFVSEVLGATVSWSDLHSSVFVRRDAAVASFRNSYYPASYVNVSVSGNALQVSGADSGSDSWVWVMVRDSTGERIAEAIVPLSADRTYLASLDPRLALGQYTVDVYMGPARFGTYISRHLGIALVQGSQALALPQSPMYEHNYAQFSSTQRDLMSLVKFSLADKAQETALLSLAAEITRGIDSDYMKLLAIHDWVAQNIYYDFDGMATTSYQANTPYPVFLSRRAVCQGYAELTSALLRASGIPARVVVGHALGATSSAKTWDEADHSKSNHAWNEAYVSGRWVILDVTWDSGNKYQGGDFVAGDVRHTYFDITLEALSLTHKIMK